MNAWMPSASPSATATITTSSTIELTVDFGRFLTVFVPVLTPLVAGGNASLGVGGVGRGVGSARWPSGIVGGRLALRPGIGDSLGARLISASRARLRVVLTTPLNGSLAALAVLCLLDDGLGDRLLGRHAIGVGCPGGLDGRGVEQQTRLDGLLGARVAALAHTRALADPVAQVVELRAAHVAARGQLDALDLRRVHREHALDADAEGLLAHRERLARTVALALDDDALEDLHAAARALDHLEVDLHAVAGREVGNAAQLRALDGCDDAAHDGEGRGAFWQTAGAPRGVRGRREVQW